MNVKTTLPISEARKRIFDIAEDVQKPGNYYTFTEKGRAKAVIMSAEDFESLQETMEVMREFPDIEKDIKKAETEFKKGDYITLDDLMQKYGYVLRESPKQKYGKKKYVIQTNNTKKGSKRSR